jgi:beta-lactam-binding protein with PASTA domain
VNTRRIAVVSLVACLLLTAGCTAIGCGVAVPDVKGKTPEQAEVALKAEGFNLGKVTWDEAAEGAPGAVIAQEPAAGTSSKEGAPVGITVVGAAPVTVPSVVGLSKTAASAALTAVRLTLGDVIESYAATTPAGAVVQQEPPAGTVVPDATAVKVVVSKGPEPVAPAAAEHVKVPLVKGLKISSAKAKIIAAGLKWKYLTGPGNGLIGPGFVYKQAPASGTSVNEGSVVTIYEMQAP